MARAGDCYVIILKRAHLEWGVLRYTGSRGIVYGEGYIPIPAQYSRNFDLKNNNGTNYRPVFGENLFNCRSADGLYNGVLRAQGCQNDSNYAKQFSENGNLKALGDWYYAISACEGDQIKVTWASPTDIIIEKL